VLSTDDQWAHPDTARLLGIPDGGVFSPAEIDAARTKAPAMSYVARAAAIQLAAPGASTESAVR